MVRFFVLGLAPNAARLQIRFFFVDTLGTLLARIQQHCRDILFEEAGPGVRVPTIRQLVYELFPRDGEGKARTAESDRKKIDKLQAELLRAVLTGQDFPQTLLPTVLGRLRADGAFRQWRLGLVKACLNRAARASGAPGSEVTMELDETVDDPGYLLGRLFALLENLQVLSRGGGDSPTIKDRFASTASVTPRAVFPHLLGLSDAHAKKARRDKPGVAHNLVRRIGELTARFDPTVGGFPALLDLRQQGLFFIGYHQQRQSFFRKGEAQGSAAEASAGDTTEASEE
jgi:CRISPR-associated protein Csd1